MASPPSEKNESVFSLAPLAPTLRTTATLLGRPSFILLLQAIPRLDIIDGLIVSAPTQNTHGPRPAQFP